MDAQTSTPAAAAPAQSTPSAPAESPKPIATTPADAAVVADDVAAYREARRAERGDPRRASAAPSAAPATPEAAPAQTQADGAPLSNRKQREQQRINDYERTVAELRAENARLKGSPAPPPPPDHQAPRPANPLAVDVSKPPLEEAAFYTQHPNASTADYFRYLHRFDREVEQVSEQMRASQRAAETAAHERATKFHAQITAAGDPAAIIERLDPALVALETRAAAQAQGKPISAANDLADEILDSDVAMPVLEYLTAHPDVRAKLLASPNRRALVREFSRLEAQFTPAATSGPVPKTTTDAPTPPVTLGSRAAQMGDPVDRAVAQGDVAAYRAARLAQRAATLR